MFALVVRKNEEHKNIDYFNSILLHIYQTSFYLFYLFTDTDIKNIYLLFLSYSNLIFDGSSIIIETQWILRI